MDGFERILYIYEIPVNFVRDITIPPCEEEKWVKWKAIVCCLISPFFATFILGFLDSEIGGVNISVVIGPIGVVLGLIVWKTTHVNHPPAYMWIFCIFGFVLALMWIG
jgi:hypothetical protein